MAGLEFKLKKVDETKHYLLARLHVRIESFAVEIIICAITSGIKRYKPIIKK